jgi:hypothetical protein
MFKKSLLTLLFVLIFQSDAFSKETFYLQCPIKSEINKTQGRLEWFTEVGKITELRFFKLQIKKSSAHITIHSALLMHERTKQSKMYSDKLSDDEFDLKNRKFKWTYFDNILADNGTLEDKNGIWEASGIIIYKDEDIEVVKYAHRSKCLIIDKKTYKDSLKKKWSISSNNTPYSE